MNKRNALILGLLAFVAVTTACLWPNKHSISIKTSAVWSGGAVRHGSNVYEWMLGVPKSYRAFIRDPWTIYDDDEGTPPMVYGGVTIDGEFTTGYSRPRGLQALEDWPQFFVIKFNGEYGSKAATEYCLTQDQYGPMWAAPGHTGYVCRSDLCEVHLSYHGWNVDVTVPSRGMYREPVRVCEIVRKSLDRWTTYIDNLNP
jgi:hypothetical protein